MHPLRCLLLLSFLLIPCSVAFAQTDDTKPDPIDTIVKKMMDKDPSTPGMQDAIQHGTDLWDAQMNIVYGQLMKKLPANERTDLQKSQRAWLAYRDAQTELVGTIYAHAEGTEFRSTSANELLNLVKTRTLLLRAYLVILEENSQ